MTKSVRVLGGATAVCGKGALGGRGQDREGRPRQVVVPLGCWGTFPAQDPSEGSGLLDPGRAVLDAVFRVRGGVAVVPGLSGTVSFLGDHPDRRVRRVCAG